MLEGHDLCNILRGLHNVNWFILITLPTETIDSLPYRRAHHATATAAAEQGLLNCMHVHIWLMPDRSWHDAVGYLLLVLVTNKHHFPNARRNVVCVMLLHNCYLHSIGRDDKSAVTLLIESTCLCSPASACVIRSQCIHTIHYWRRSVAPSSSSDLLGRYISTRHWHEN